LGVKETTIWPPRPTGLFMKQCKRESVPQLLKNLEELKIKDAINAVTPEMISNLSSMAQVYIYAQSTAFGVPNLSTR